MRVTFTPLKRLVLGTFLTLGLAGPVLAAPVNLNYSTIYNGTSTVTTNTGAATNTLPVPGSYTYANTYSQTQVIPTSPAPGYGFYDDYIINITGATASSITTTIDFAQLFQITNLQERIYSVSGNSVPTIGAPLAGTMVIGWQTPIGTIGTASVISNQILNPGVYVLEIRGNAAGTLGGSYSGSLNLAAVPLPAALPLMLSGLGFLGGFRRRAKA